MAMNGDTLGLAIKSAIDALVAAGDGTDRAKLFKAIGNAIVEHITTSGVVNVVVSNAVPAAPGPVTGTGTVS